MKTSKNNARRHGSRVKRTPFYVFGAVGLALAAIGAGICETAQTGTKNCAGTAEASCFLAIDPPCKGVGAYVCVKVSAPSNRKPGICGAPKNNETQCVVTSNYVVNLYEWFQPVTNNGVCECSEVLVDKCTEDVPCAVSQQTDNQEGCVTE